MKELLCGREFAVTCPRRMVVACGHLIGHDGPCEEKSGWRTAGFDLKKAMEGRRTFECDNERETPAAFAWALAGDTVTVPAGTILIGDEIKPGVTVRTEGSE